ncbi:DUF3558 domain-containing protein [Gordonia sp. X0973]|uniref:DUF3558 family protein n=1 Tax=Gordonia sp. X0973 TaxID=2742602 RepID=UPI0013ED69F5|nr:DUF3558 family protein [Gordonia sp. X0973]QKT06975.1 DUF3558 domain-containing protein [Gordonia sp. X0973]
MAAALLAVIVLGGGIALLVTNKTTPGSTDPTKTATVASDQSPWRGKLPNPCDTIPNSAVKAAGLDPAARHDVQSHVKSIRGCMYFSPQPKGLQYDATYTWSLNVWFSTYPYDEQLHTDTIYDLRPTTLHGQPASYFQQEIERNTPGNKCGVMVGTTFGVAYYYAGDDTNHPLTPLQVCEKAWNAANTMQPFVPTDTQPK